MEPDQTDLAADLKADLKKEARHLHHVFFGCDAPPEVVDRYVAANVVCGLARSSVVGTIVNRELDAEAIELVLRRRSVPTTLTQKIRILFYLVEVRSPYYAFFVGDGEGGVRAAWGLASSLLQSVAKYIKGAYLVRRHRLV